MPCRRSPGLGGPPVAILSHELWQSAFGGQPIVGHTVQIDGRPHDIIGIMPPGFDVMDNRTEIWLPIGIHPVIRQLRENHVLQVIGRLKDGVTPQAAGAELSAFLENWGERAGVTVPWWTRSRKRRGTRRLRIRRVHRITRCGCSRCRMRFSATRDASSGCCSRRPGLVLVIACANLASLVLARAESRRREFALRAALGASRGRLIQQTMTEGAMLSVAGGAIGLWVARVGLRTLVVAYPTSLPRTSELTMDLPVLLFALVVSVATGVLFGVAPAVQSRLVDLVHVLKEGHRDGGAAGRHRVRRALVTAEVALAVMLVDRRRAARAHRRQSHARRRRLRSIADGHVFDDAAANRHGRRRTRPRASAIARHPSPDAGRAGRHRHVRSALQSAGPAIQHRCGEHADGSPVAIVDYYQFVMSDYFMTMGIPIVAGRGFDATDTASGGRVVIVNETLANRLWKGRDPIGQRVRPNLGASIGTSVNPWHTVIGVAKDVKEAGVDRDAGAELYLFVDQPGPPIDGTERWVTNAPPTMHLVLRTNLPASALAPTLERAVRAVNPSVPIVGLREMDAVFDESIGRPRLLAQLLGAFAGLALLLAVLGTYGVLSFMVAERRREIGIRVAIGATRGSIVALVTKQGLVIVSIGLAAGLAGALGLNRLLGSLLFGVEPTDPGTLAAVTSTIAIVAALACGLPAWRASRLDPNVVLRGDG